VAQALWLLDRKLDAENDSVANIVERRIVPALIRSHDRGNHAFKLAAILGGPVIAEFLLRQNWRSEPLRHDSPDWMHGGAGRGLNRWLYLLAHLRGPEGDEFRDRHGKTILGFVDLMLAGDFDRDRPPEFLFHDVARGEKSLAFRYWPTYCAEVEGSLYGDTALRILWGYLQRMEPIPTVEMYLDCWRRREPASHSHFVLNSLKGLPNQKKQALGTAMLRDMERMVDELRRAGRDRESQKLQYSLPGLQDLVRSENDEERARHLIKNLRQKPDKKLRSNIGDWLEHTQPDHPAVPLLADADEPGLRLLTIGALKSHPTPEHQALLERLLTDEDAEVKQAAVAARERLDGLAETDPFVFAEVSSQGQAAP